MICLTSLLRHKFKLVFVFVAMAAAHSVSAQKQYTLEECIKIALKNNVSVKQRELNEQTSKADYFQSKMALLPTVNGQVTNNYNVGFAINPVTNTTEADATFRSNNFGINASMTLFNGFQNSNNVRLQQSNLKATGYDVNATRNTVALNVSNAYMQVLSNQEIVESRKLQTETTKEQLKRQEKLYELGGVNRVKLLQIKAQLANEESQLVTAQTQLDQSYLTLWQLMNMPVDSGNKVVKLATDSVKVEDEVASADKIYHDFLSKSPEVQAAKQRARSAELSSSIALGGRSPRITMNAGLNSFYTTQNRRGAGIPTSFNPIIGYDAGGAPIYSATPYNVYSGDEVVPFSTQFDRNLGKSLGFTLTIPIFNGWQTNNNIQKSRISQTNATFTQTQAELDLYKNVNQAYLDFKSAQKKYDAAQNNYDANKEAYALAESQFNLGALNTADFLNTKNQYLQAQTTLVQNKYELLLRRKVLDFYLGKPLY